jgi:hypothetical protein
MPGAAVRKCEPRGIEDIDQPTWQGPNDGSSIDSQPLYI